MHVSLSYPPGCALAIVSAGGITFTVVTFFHKWSNVSRSAPNVTIKSFPFTSAAIFLNFSPRLYLLFLLLLQSHALSSVGWLYQLVTWDSTFPQVGGMAPFVFLLFLRTLELSIG